jgi:hypothetical protein
MVKIIHVDDDNQATPPGMILLNNVYKSVNVIVCQTSAYLLNTNLMNIASNTADSIHTLERDIRNVFGIPVNDTTTIETHTYRKR